MKIFLLSLLVVSSFNVFASEKSDHTYKVKWVLAHEPVGLFTEAASQFAKEVTEKTNGHVKFEIMTLPEYEKKYNHSQKIKESEFVSKIQNNEVEMSQTYTTDLGVLNKSLYVLDLPYLFRDHEHAKKVLEGQVGEELLSGLASANIRGLAFTYSGGYRILPGTKQIKRLEDFEGLKIRTSNSPVAQDMLTMLGAKPVPLSLPRIESNLKNGTIDEAESTYARYFPLGTEKVAKVVNETNHSLFLTSIIINEKFWNTLPSDYQKIMKEAAIRAARVERNHSIEAIAETRKRCLENGIQIVTMDKKEEQRVRAALEPLYKKYRTVLGDKLVSSIEAQ